MKKTIIILAHPNMDDSIANKTIIEEVRKLDNVEVRDLAALYPDFRIDVKAEQAALLTVDRIVFQYPIYWYNMPPILRQWFDLVLTYGFAFGKNAYKLEGKEMFASVTLGGPKEEGANEIMESKILFPLQATAAFCKMKYLPSIALYGIIAMEGMDKVPLMVLAKEHSKKLIESIQD